MAVIWKFPIQCNAKPGWPYQIRVEMPEGAKILCVMNQTNGDGVCLWAEVNQYAQRVTRVILCVGTGCGEVPIDATYIGSVLDGDYVWHLYDENLEVIEDEAKQCKKAAGFAE